MYKISRNFNGKTVGVILNEREHITVNGSGWLDFLEWNAKQNPPLDLSDKEPDPPTVKEIEAARKFSVALQFFKNIPESHETGTAQQQFMWACKHLYKRVAQEID